MKVAIFGAGAIGGYLGAHLAATGAEVSLVARGPHLAAIQDQGLVLVEGGERRVSRPRATTRAADLGPQDVVIIALKAHSVPAVVGEIGALLGPATAVVPAVNGVPWWYFHAHPGPYANHQLASVDPGGVQWAGIGPERVIGCVVYPACEITAPGVVTHIEGDRFVLGEPSGERSPRVTALSTLLIQGGLKAPIRPRIRNEIWVKLWGNVAFNPVSALTGATLEAICQDPATRGLVRGMMLEAEAIGARLGVEFGVDVERRIQGAEKVGAHKTSMLQDLERGRPMEIDAVVAAVAELGRLTGVATPLIDAVLALVRQRARLAGCYA